MILKINTDIGENFGIWKIGNDKGIIPYLDYANIPCGFHAGDANSINNSVLLAKNFNKTIGAHPAYNDLTGFGKRSIACPLENIKNFIIYQLGILNAFCTANDTHISYVKPHGALYKDMNRDINIFKAILKGIASFNKNIKLMILSSQRNEEYEYIAKMYNINLLYEVYINRNYSDSGTLLAKSFQNAIISSELEIVSRVISLKDKGYILSVNNKKLYLKANTIYINGSKSNSINFIRTVRDALN